MCDELTGLSQLLEMAIECEEYIECRIDDLLKYFIDHPAEAI
jgi:hypothetical protein